MKMSKVTIELEQLAEVWPWVMEIPNLPRKKKKAAKKLLAHMVREAVEAAIENWEDHKDIYDAEQW